MFFFLSSVATRRSFGFLNANQTGTLWWPHGSCRIFETRLLPPAKKHQKKFFSDLTLWHTPRTHATHTHQGNRRQEQTKAVFHADQYLNINIANTSGSFKHQFQNEMININTCLHLSRVKTCFASQYGGQLRLQAVLVQQFCPADS